MLRNMFKKTYTKIDEKFISREQAGEEPSVPQGMWRKCNKCGQPIYVEDVVNNHYVCPKCGGYFRVHAYRRIEMLADEGSFEEWNREMEFSNPLDFPGYERKVLATREKTHLEEAIVTGKCSIEGNPAVIGVCDARFIMSSMGHVVGEKITEAVERATQEKLPVILFACSGGARMQEGIVSLMQMAKTSAALKRHHEAGQLFISVLTDPTTGGVTASFAMLGDIILAEPNALIGFAGPRVIEQTIGQKLPEGFQRAEFLLEHGFVDKIVERQEQKQVIGSILRLHRADAAAADVLPEDGEAKTDAAPDYSEDELDSASKTEKTAWDTVLLSRKANRPTALDYINLLFDDFMEFHGDRYFGDDSAVMGGIAYFQGVPVTVIAQVKGHSTKENIEKNFGMSSPEGYRKALRLMKQAEKFHRPIICFVDTPGAFCGIEAEERGQGEAIARNLFEMSGITVPILSIFIGEGGSGGALAMAVADEVWMLENAVYSILSPEGYASILWKDGKLADKAAEAMKMTADDLKDLKIVEKIIREPEDYHVDNMEDVIARLKGEIAVFIEEKQKLPAEEIVENRYNRFRRM